MKPLGARHPSVQDLRRLCRRASARAESGSYVVDGLRHVLDVLGRGAEVRALYVDEGLSDASREGLHEAALSHGANLTLVSAGVLGRVLATVTPQGVAAVVARPPTLDPAGAGFDAAVAAGPWVLLDGVQDPGNVGAVVRVGEAAGVGAVVLGPSCADPFGPKAVRSAAGSQEGVRFLEVADPAAFCGDWTARGGSVVGAARSGRPWSGRRLGPGTVLVLGAEGTGISPAVDRCCTERVALPMAGAVESLNVAVAAGILLYGGGGPS